MGFFLVEKGGPLPPLPCVVAGSGTHEHGQTFLKNNFHYKCNNGTAEVIGNSIFLGHSLLEYLDLCILFSMCIR